MFVKWKGIFHIVIIYESKKRVATNSSQLTSFLQKVFKTRSQIKSIQEKGLIFHYVRYLLKKRKRNIGFEDHLVKGIEGNKHVVGKKILSQSIILDV